MGETIVVCACNVLPGWGCGVVIAVIHVVLRFLAGYSFFFNAVVAFRCFVSVVWDEEESNDYAKEPNNSSSDRPCGWFWSYGSVYCKIRGNDKAYQHCDVEERKKFSSDSEPVQA